MAEPKDYRKLDDLEIVNLLDDNIKRSVGYYDSQLSRERQKVMDYYTARLPKPAHDGNSKYVSMDVYDAVEAMKAALLETFAAGNRIVRFSPQGQDDVDMARVCSEYTDYVAFRQNDLYSVMQTVIHDGLIARAGIAKAYWADQTDLQVQTFEDLTESELDMLLAQDGVELIDSEPDDVGLLSGEISYSRDSSQVIIEAIAPEEFVIEPQAKSLEDVNFCAHRTTKTISELREAGFDEELLKDIGDHEDVDMETDPEVLSRHEDIGSDRGFNANGYQDQIRSIMVYEAYIMLDTEGTGIAELHRVVKAGNVLLDIETVDRKPFFCFVPLPIPHAFFGSNFAEKLVATQNARTVLTRSILDHALITNNPRYMVTKGGLTNPRELIDNRVGGIVNVSRPDAIAPMPQAPLNPFIFQTIQMLDEDKEENTGVSRLSQGLNKDAISKQNSAAMVEQLATMSQQRQKIIARNFANQFMKPLFLEIYRLCVENEDQDKIVEIGGNYVSVNPSRWEEQRDVVVELKLGYGEQERESQKYMAMHQVFSQDPGLSKMYTIENQHALMRDVMNMSGIKNTDDYLTPPDQLPPEQPNEMAQMQMQMAQKQLELQERQTSLAEMKAEIQASIDQMKLELEKAKVQNDLALKADGMDLKEEQFAHKQRIDEAELELASRADEITAIASPQG